MAMDPNAFTSEPYTSSKGVEFVVFANRHGRWRIERDGAVIKSGGDQDFYGKPRWGSKKLQAEAFAAARAAIEAMQG
jgi:hypothetical protein